MIFNADPFLYYRLRITAPIQIKKAQGQDSRYNFWTFLRWTFISVLNAHARISRFTSNVTKGEMTHNNAVFPLNDKARSRPYWCRCCTYQTSAFITYFNWFFFVNNCYIYRNDMIFFKDASLQYGKFEELSHWLSPNLFSKIINNMYNFVVVKGYSFKRIGFHGN